MVGEGRLLVRGLLQRVPVLVRVTATPTVFVIISALALKLTLTDRKDTVLLWMARQTATIDNF